MNKKDQARPHFTTSKLHHALGLNEHQANLLASRVISRARREIHRRKLVEANAVYRQNLLEKVLQLGKNVTAITDLQACLLEIHNSIRHGLGFDRVGLFLYDPDCNRIQGTYGTSRTGEREDTSWYTEDGDTNSVWYKALHTPKGMIIIDDYQAAMNPSPESEMYGVHQYATLAAWAGDRPLAVIAADNLTSQRILSPADFEALLLFAGFAGLAIANARLQAGLEQEIRARTQKLRERESLYRALFENSNDGIFLLTAQGQELRANQRALDMIEYTSAEYERICQEGCCLFACDPQDSQTRDPYINAALRGETVPLYERVLFSRSGRRIVVEVNLSPIYGEDGEPILIQCVVRDISARIHAENEIRAASELFHEFMRHSPIYAFIKEVTPQNSLVLFSSENFVDMIGVPGSQMVGKTMYDFFPEEFARKITADDWAVVSSGEMVTLDEELDGRFYTSIKFPVFIGERRLLAGYTIDVTDRKNSEYILRESELQNRLLFEETPEPILLLDENGLIVRANHAYAQLTGIPQNELLGSSPTDTGIVSEPLMNTIKTEMEQIIDLHKEGIAQFQHPLYCRDGRICEVESKVFVIRLGGKNHVLVASRDITAEKQIQNTLQEAKTALERSLKLKDEFLANMSHELRTPLTGILGLTEAPLLQTYGSMNEKQIKALENINASGQHLLELINDILDLSKIEADKLDLYLEPCFVSDICQISLRLTRELASRKNQNVVFSTNLPYAQVKADSRRFKQMVVNLLSNAIKFTPAGGNLGIEVVCDERSKEAHIIVWDQGIGIDPAYMDRLFKPFTQIDGSLARQHSGTGLGLALVARLAAMHKGSVQVESKPGAGSRFTLILPMI